jgi:ADP-ribose pyrophosphatase
MNPPETLLETSRFRVVRQRYRTRDGREHQREIILHPGAVTILPLVGDDQVCLIRNYRPSVDQTLLELPAGTLEPGEDPKLAAERELEEETGYRAQLIEPLHELYMSPGILRERMHLYLATGLESGQQHLDAGEQIDWVVVPWREALAMTQDGRIQDAKTLVGLLFYETWRRRPTT